MLASFVTGGAICLSILTSPRRTQDYSSEKRVRPHLYVVVHVFSRVVSATGAGRFCYLPSCRVTRYMLRKKHNAPSPINMPTHQYWVAS